MDTLPDYLRPGLEAISIGLNPSLPSVRAGFYFANPRNRFWRALQGAGILPPGHEPGVAATEWLFRTRSIGFTDAVKRPSAGGGELRAADYRRWCPRLCDTLERDPPRIAWFHGKTAYQSYLRHAHGRRDRVTWGAQSESPHDFLVFVTPNPSSANAAFSLSDLIARYGELRTLLEAVYK